MAQSQVPSFRHVPRPLQSSGHARASQAAPSQGARHAHLKFTHEPKYIIMHYFYSIKCCVVFCHKKKTRKNIYSPCCEQSFGQTIFWHALPRALLEAVMANALSVPTVDGARISFVQPFRQRQFASPSLVSHHPCGRLHCINHNYNSVCEAKNDAKSENIIFPNKSSAVFSHKLKF